MNMYYDPETRGFYDKHVHGSKIPSTAIKVNNAMYIELLDGKSMGKTITVNDQKEIELTERKLKFNFTFSFNSKNNEIRQAFSQYMQPITEGYTAEEIASFPTQEPEALAWQADNTAATPLIDGILQQRTSIDKPTLVQRIIDNSVDYKTVAGQAIGKKQHFEDLLYALKQQHEDRDQPDVTQADLDAIVVDFSTD